MCQPVLLEGHLLGKQVHAEFCVCVRVIVEEKGRIHLVSIMIMIHKEIWMLMIFMLIFTIPLFDQKFLLPPFHQMPVKILF